MAKMAAAVPGSLGDDVSEGPSTWARLRLSKVWSTTYEWQTGGETGSDYPTSPGTTKPFSQVGPGRNILSKPPIKFCHILKMGSSEITRLGSGTTGVLERDN